MLTQHNYIIILVDCLRKYFLSCYNQQLPYSTPHIDNLAKGGCCINRLISQSSWTKPAIASLFCGLYPFNHKVHSSYDKLMLHPTIATSFKNTGYTTKAFSANPYITEDAGFAQGFDLFWLSESLNGHLVYEKVVHELHTTPRPYFYYLHFMDTHAPYYPDDQYKKIAGKYAIKGGEKVTLCQHALQELITLYQGAVQKTDNLIGKLLQHVNLDNTNIVLLSDHGDEFYEHTGLFHGAGKLYRENIEVPLIFSGPDFVFPDKVDTYVNLVDLPPTILESAAIEYDPVQFDGTSFYSELQSNREIVHVTFSEVVAHSFNKRSEALIKDKFKLICYYKKSTTDLYSKVLKSFCHCLLKLDLTGIVDLSKRVLHTLERKIFLTNKGRKPIELYDLTNDPEELHNIADDFPEKASSLIGEIDKLKEKANANAIDSVDQIDVNDEIKERLKDLGYM